MTKKQSSFSDASFNSRFLHMMSFRRNSTVSKRVNRFHCPQQRIMNNQSSVAPSSQIEWQLVTWNDGKLKHGGFRHRSRHVHRTQHQSALS